MIDRTTLERLYRKYNRRKYVHPDPLEFLYGYPDVRDREIVALIASSLAYGRVSQILKSVDRVLSKMRPSPYVFIRSTSARSLTSLFSGFKHRFTMGEQLAELLTGVKKIINDYGSLNTCFVSCINDTDKTVLRALGMFVAKLGCEIPHLIPLPEAGSACKRLNLFLRWMVRDDAVDPGGWTGISRAQLIIPLDTHMAKVGKMLELTKRRAPNMGMALDITSAFRDIVPDDPVKYDFALTRLGIREGLDMQAISQILMRRH